MTPDESLALGRRAGLPADLLWLLEKHPRGSWDGALGEVGRFWLSRHAMFRDAQAALVSETRAFADSRADAAAFGPRFYRLAGFLLAELETHHQIEDFHYFPKLIRLEPKLQRAFDLLDADHHALHDALEGVTDAANSLLSALRGPEARPSAARAVDALDGLGALLDRHLADEEDIVAPILARHGESRLG
jgi:iron-sulfur cluster repair protein YtfE (RIC family)